MTCSRKLRSRGRSGTILVFTLAAMSITTLFVTILAKMGQAPGAVAASREFQIIADAMALSGQELMITIGQNTTENGSQFLLDRVRLLDDGQPYSYGALFGLSTGAEASQYLPPLEYPPLKDICLREAPVDVTALNRFDNDIRLPSNFGLLPVNTWTSVPGSTVNIPPQQYGVLPAPNFLPSFADTVDYHYDAPLFTLYNVHGTLRAPTANGHLIKALQPADAPVGVRVALPWIGPKGVHNAGGVPQSPYLPRFPAVMWDASVRKMPTPSFIFCRDVPNTSPQRRAYAYCWYATRDAVAPAVVSNRHYFMTSGRVRLVYPGAIPGTLSNELVVGSTQVR